MRGEDDADIIEVGLPSPSVKALHLCIRNEGYGGPEQPTRWETNMKLAIEIKDFTAFGMNDSNMITTFLAKIRCNIRLLKPCVNH